MLITTSFLFPIANNHFLLQLRHACTTSFLSFPITCFLSLLSSFYIANNSFLLHIEHAILLLFLFQFFIAILHTSICLLAPVCLFQLRHAPFANNNFTIETFVLFSSFQLLTTFPSSNCFYYFSSFQQQQFPSSSIETCLYHSFLFPIANNSFLLQLRHACTTSSSFQLLTTVFLLQLGHVVFLFFLFPIANNSFPLFN
ncbi:unnamed protein product [Acanthosepion pharaonis]|uniref:Uncharacterized protein n=1 Tax=Acanthosepion pharaonis TaxID=158019 RepID=A0A812CDT0_ACAPH|nr:unnamed protein product [Sepia pharaonis]